MKLYEILLRKAGFINDPLKPTIVQEENIYNPLRTKVGANVILDVLDYRDYRYVISEIQAYTIKLANKTHNMVDYLLVGKKIGSPNVNYRLRVVPDLDSNSKVTHRAMILSLYDTIAYDQGFLDIVQDDSLKFDITDDSDSDNVILEEYWRVNDVKSSYKAKLTSLADEDRDGIVEENEVSQSSVEFWDFSRLTQIDGVETEQFLFIEMSKSTGEFNLWKGLEINPERVDVT